MRWVIDYYMMRQGVEGSVYIPAKNNKSDGEGILKCIVAGNTYC